MQRNNDVLEEDNVLISQRNRVPTDNAGKYFQKLGCTVEPMLFMNESDQALVDGLSDHLSPGHKFGVKLVEDVLEVLSFFKLF